MITVPGDRRDEDIRAVGRLCARLDRVIIKEDNDRRGRAPGRDRGAAGARGCARAGLHGDQIEVVPDRGGRGGPLRCEVIGDGDLLVILADDVTAVLAQLRPHASAAGSTTGARKDVRRAKLCLAATSGIRPPPPAQAVSVYAPTARGPDRVGDDHVAPGVRER